MADKYIYAVTRIHCRETRCLDGGFIESLLSAKDVPSALKLLSEHGWGDGTQSPEELLEEKRRETWALMKSLTGGGDRELDVFLIVNDFHNLKAAVKKVVTPIGERNVYIENCTVAPAVLEKCVSDGVYFALPQDMRDCAAEAVRALRENRDGQLCDVIIDRACMESIWAHTRKGNEVFRLYGENLLLTGAVKTAVRAARTGKNRDFLERALPDAGVLGKRGLVEAAARGEEEIRSFLSKVGYGDAARALEKSVTAFEVWCDDALMTAVQPQKSAISSIGPLAAYLLASDNEIKTVRIILTGIRSGISPDVLRERVRQMYV